MDKFICLIPAYNEGRAIFSVVSKVKKYVAGVIVVDDGSGDETGKRAEKAGAIVLRHDKNKGKGAALKAGLNYILENYPSAEAVIMMDGDGQHNPDEIEKFLGIWGNQKSDLIIGARNFQSQTLPVLRRFWNKFISWLISGIVSSKIKDSQSGFRLISRDLASKIISDLRTGDYRVESEMIFCAAEAGAGVGEVPIRAIFNKQFRLFDFLKNGLRLFKILSFVLRKRISRIFSYSGFSSLKITAVIIGFIFLSYLVAGDCLTLKTSLSKDYQYSQEMIDALNWLKNHSAPGDIVLSEWTQGHQVVSLAERRVVATSKVYPSEAQEVAGRYKDLANFFFAASEDQAAKVLEKYDISRIFIKKNFDQFICRYVNACAYQQTIISKMLKGDDLGIISKIYESQNFLIYKVNKTKKDADSGLVRLYSGVFDPSLIKRGFSESAQISKSEDALGIIIPHHYPYVNYLYGDIFNRLAAPKTVVVIGPDHEDKSSVPITTASAFWETPFGALSPDEGAIKLLSQNGVKIDNPAHLREWSIRTAFPYLKYAFPDAEVVPIMIKNSASGDDIEKLANLLTNKLSASKTLYILSTDFAHHLPIEKADEDDAASIEAIKSRNKSEIGFLNLDSRAGLDLFLSVMEKEGVRQADLISHSNDFEITKKYPEFKPYPYLVTYMIWLFSR